MAVASVDKLIPEPAINSNVSLFEPAVMSDCPLMRKVLKIFWLDPRSVFVKARPLIDSPSVAEKVMSPVSFCTEVIPAAALMVAFWPPVMVMPSPGVRL